jgi:putative hydroxymethylpyrimidine transport system substrate-binding protein
MMRALIVALALLASGTAAAQDKLTVMLDWFVNPDHGPLFVAQERGSFTSRGLNVDLVAPADPNDPPKLVAAGKADIAVSYQPQLHLQVAENLPLKRIGTLVATPLNSLVVLADGPIKQIADLKGRKIGYSVGGFEQAVLGAMLSKHGLSLQDVTLVNVNFSLSPSILAGRVDAVVGAFRNFELNQMAIEKHPGRAFFVEEEGVPPYDELIFVAKTDRVADPKLRRFIDAIEEAVQYMLNHPKEAWALFIKGRGELDDELNRRAWADTLPRFALRPGAVDMARYERFARFLEAQKMIPKALPASAYAIELPSAP